MSVISDSNHEKARAIAVAIEQDPHYAALRLNQGIWLRVENPQTHIVDTVRVSGVTKYLEAVYWPHAIFVKKSHLSGHIPGTLYVNPDGEDEADELIYIDTLERVPKLKKERRNFRTIMADAIQRGTLVHSQLQAYFKAFRSLPYNKIEQGFVYHLHSENLGAVSPATLRILSAFNKEDGQGLGNPYGDRWVPVLAEVPVISQKSLSSYLAEVPKPRVPSKWTSGRGRSASAAAVAAKAIGKPLTVKKVQGTVADAIVYSEHKKTLCILEYKTTTGEFNVGKGHMLGALRDMSDSKLLQACVQLTLTIHYFKDTYKSILVANGLSTDLYGYVISSDPDGVDFGCFELEPKFQKAILAKLATDSPQIL